MSIVAAEAAWGMDTIDLVSELLPIAVLVAVLVGIVRLVRRASPTRTGAAFLSRQAIVLATALVVLLVGQAGLIHVAVERLHRGIAGEPVADVRTSSAPWGALFIVAAAVWIGVWLRDYEHGPRTDAWYTVVVPIGTLVGFTASFVSIARLAWLLLVWFFGDPGTNSAFTHFEELSVWVGIGLTGAISHLYHRALLGTDAVRNEAMRAAEFLMLFASVVATTVGTVLVAMALFDPAGVDVNRLFAGLTTAIPGLIVAVWIAQIPITHHNGPAGAAERDSAIRRTYYHAVLGLGILVCLLAGIEALRGIFEDLLDGRATGRTFANHRGELATMFTLLPVLWIHHLAYRADREHAEHESFEQLRIAWEPAATRKPRKVKPGPAAVADS